jgi:serine/threonine-protein kinase RsbW
MENLQREKILASVEAADFIGRSREIDALLHHANGESKIHGLRLLSAPAVGASELLKQVFDQLFYTPNDVVPFYFAIKISDKNASQCALRFLQKFLLQTVAFRRQNAKLINFGNDICEISQIAIPSDVHWIDRLLESCRAESRLNNERAFVRTALSAPLRAFANNAKVFVMIDDLHEAAHFSGEIDFLAELTEVFSRAEFPFVFASKRRFLLENETSETLQLNLLTFSDAGFLAENLAEKFDVELNPQTRDLIAVQFNGNPLFTKFLLQNAAEKKVNLESFGKVQKIYANEIFGGRISKYFDAVFARIAPNIETQKHFSGLLFDALTVENNKTHLENWQFRTNLTDAEFYRATQFLNVHEIIGVTSNLVDVSRENRVLTDYLEARFRLETAAQNRALTVGESLSDYLKRVPKMMAEFYRQKSAIGLRELLSVFDLQEIPRSLLDYSAFKNELKGAPNAEMLKALKSETEKIALPQIVYTAQTVALYPQFAQLAEKNRSAVALGFQETVYTDEDEIVWIAAEIDSKLEATKELTEFWCDRLEMVALMCNFVNYKLWLVAPEGFSLEATEVLQNRNAFGSSKKQVELLIDFLDAREAVGEKLKANEYEMIVPMGEDTELIAAQTVEEIARRHNFAPKSINQIKTALVEACINATEHSHSPDRKIYQKFTVEDDKIIITISNRGLRLTDKTAQEIKPDEGRRGWGLKLMKTLMDDVKIEQTEDGTRISMTKYLKNS